LPITDDPSHTSFSLKSVFAPSPRGIMFSDAYVEAATLDFLSLMRRPTEGTRNDFTNNYYSLGNRSKMKYNRRNLQNRFGCLRASEVEHRTFTDPPTKSPP
jgi:hypothetical protein